MQLTELKRQVHRLATQRGHALIWCMPAHGEHQFIQTAFCSQCEAEAEIMTRSLDNSPLATGDAFQVNCPHPITEV